MTVHPTDLWPSIPLDHIKVRPRTKEQEDMERALMALYAAKAEREAALRGLPPMGLSSLWGA